MREGRARRRNSSTSIRNLSQELLINVLSRLSTKDILNCKCVSRPWYNSISDPEFARSHRERSANSDRELMLLSDGPGSISRTLFLIDPDELKPYADFCIPQNDKLAFSAVDVVNSCNGLVCLCNSFDRNPVLVCNPITREYINIPSIEIGKNVTMSNINPIGCECALCLEYDQVESLKKLVGSGFGFSPKSNDYKVIRIFDQEYSNGFGGRRRNAEIYTLGERSWRSIEFSPQFQHSLFFGTYLKETLYWVCADKNHEFEFIVSFNFENEVVDILSMPLIVTANGQKDIRNIRMQELGGCISVCDFSSARSFDVWLRKDYGGKKHWIKGYVVYMLHYNIYEPIKLVNNADILMIEGLKKLISYNNLDMKVKDHKIRRIQSCFGAFVLRPSFVSLKDIVKGYNTEVKTAKLSSRCICGVDAQSSISRHLDIRILLSA